MLNTKDTEMSDETDYGPLISRLGNYPTCKRGVAKVTIDHIHPTIIHILVAPQTAALLLLAPTPRRQQRRRRRTRTTGPTGNWPASPTAAARPMADTRTTILPSEPQPPSSPTYPHTPAKAQAGSFGNRTTSFSFPALDPGRAESASVNGNGNGYSSAPRRQYHLSTTAAGAASSDGASSIPDVRNVYGSVSPTSHGAQSPGHRRDASGSQLARTNASHATALSDALHETPASSSMTTSPQTLKHRPQPLQQPPLARRLSTDRRVRSEAIPEARRHMSISGRRPSVLTGGYESSTDDEDEHEAGQEQGQKRRRGASGVFGGPSNNGQNGQPETSMATHASRAHLSGNRRRAQSLMVNPTLQFSPPISPARRPSRLRPPGSPFRSGSGTGSPGGPLRVTSDQHPLAQSSRNPSMRSNRSIAEDKGRERKRQSKLPETRRNPLAESLGLGVASRQVVLSPDQIQDLLSDVDVSSAMQMMAKPLRRQSSVVEGGSGTAPPPPPKASPPMASRPFLVSAPPPLTTGDWVGRDRGISVSSSVATPLRNVTPAGPIRRPRTMSMATSDSDGGHVPFTHHVAPNPPPQAESDIEEADETMLAPPVDLDAPPVSPQPVPIDNTAPASPKRDKKRISGLFNLRKKPRQSSPPPTPRQRVPSPHHEGAAVVVQRDREAEQRRAEAERREEELAQGELTLDDANDRTSLPCNDADPRSSLLPTTSAALCSPFRRVLLACLPRYRAATQGQLLGCYSLG